MAVIYNTSKVKFMWNNSRTKMMWKTSKAYSGASVVNYYRNGEIIHTEEIDGGEDVLHPTLPSYEGYTLVGFTLLDSDSRIDSMVATGETINLNAVFVPNTYDAYTKTTSNVETFRDTKYIISGDLGVSVTSAWNGSNSSNSVINFGDYQNGRLTYSIRRYGGGFGFYTLNSKEAQTIISSTSGWDNDTVDAINGTNHFSAQVSSSGVNETIQVFVTKVTLSNPKAWT